MLSKVGVLVQRCKMQSVDIEGLSIEGGRSNILHTMIYSSKYLRVLNQSRTIVLMQVKAIFPNALIQLTFSRLKVSGVEIRMFNYSDHQNHDTLGLWCIQMSQLITHAAFMHIAEGN